jgi:hypothetical protein
MKRDGKYSLNTFHYGCFNSLPFRQKLKNVLFLSANSIMKGKLPVLIYFCYQTDSEVTNTNIYSAVFLASPYYNYLSSTASTTMIGWRCQSNSVNTWGSLPNISDVIISEITCSIYCTCTIGLSWPYLMH